MTENLDGEICPMCRENRLTLSENEIEVAYFGKVYLFSMTCNNCKYHRADVESDVQKEPVRYTFELSSPADLNVRVVKSSGATIKIPHVITMTPGNESTGYVTNIEGVLNRVKHIIETARDSDEDEETIKKARNLLNKLFRAKCGEEKLKIIIEDPSGNSAIISDKAEKTELKKFT